MKKNIAIIIFLCSLVAGYFEYSNNPDDLVNDIKNSYVDDKNKKQDVVDNNKTHEVIKYESSDFEIINDNVPEFDDLAKTTNSFEVYSELDSLGRCGEAYANIGKDLMPTEDRESIGMIKPTGWHTVKYDIVDGKYLYNRCHLIGFQLTGENANDKNLITCTRYTNAVLMLKFENMVAEYIRETNNHVLYRVTPVYEGDNLVASGIKMEAYSIEDEGDGIMFNVYIHNIQPGIKIDYKTGESSLY